MRVVNGLPVTENALVLRTDFSDDEAWLAVCNAGGASPRSFLETTAADLEEAFHFNVAAGFELIKHAVPHLLAGGQGSIINVTSVFGRVAARGLLVYGTVKAALANRTPGSACYVGDLLGHFAGEFPAVPRRESHPRCAYPTCA